MMDHNHNLWFGMILYTIDLLMWMHVSHIKTTMDILMSNNIATIHIDMIFMYDMDMNSFNVNC